MSDKPLRVLISGSTGLIGTHLRGPLERSGSAVTALVRKQTGAGSILWNPDRGEVPVHAVSGFDVVIHLAGEPVATGRWSPEKKERILKSRVLGTRLLALALARTEVPPKLFLCASGINFYGDRGADVLDEEQPGGEGFLADVCEAWEAASEPLQGIARVAHLRIGAVLAAEGGMLATLLPLFRLGLGGPVAGGRRYVSWITMPDLVRAIRHCMASEQLQGAINVVAPNPVTNAEFTAALAAALHRPALFPVPGPMLRLVFGQMAGETVLSSIRAVPAKLLSDGFAFRDPLIGPALQRVLRPAQA